MKIIPCLAVLTTLFASVSVIPGFEFLTFATENEAGPPVRTTSADRYQRLIADLESDLGPFDSRLPEALDALATEMEEAGEFAVAVQAYERALHVTRINEGLYYEGQIPLVRKLIGSYIAQSQWQRVDDNYAYLEHLYMRLYSLDDPELESGLREISAWHVNALNLDLEGDRREHLRRANRIFRLRLSIAEAAVMPDESLLEYLKYNIAVSEGQAFASGNNGPRSANVIRDTNRRAARAKREDDGDDGGASGDEEDG